MKKIFLGLIIILSLFMITGCGDKENQNNSNNTNQNNNQQSNQKDENVDQVEIITEYINIRSEKDVESNIIGKVYKGELYSILSIDNSTFKWIEIQTNNNIHGYISGNDEYVKYYYSGNNNNENNKSSNNNEKDKSSNNNANKNDNINQNNNNDSNSNNSNNTNQNNNNNININQDNNNNNNNNSNNTNKNNTISATKNYYCSGGYSLSGTKCTYDFVMDPLITYSCSNGSQVGNECIITTKKTHAVVMVCAGINANQNINIINEYCAMHGLPKNIRSCKTGYTYNTRDNICELTTNQRIAAKQNLSCPDEYKLKNNKCVKTVSTDALYKYECPDGYLQIGDKCEK